MNKVRFVENVRLRAVENYIGENITSNFLRVTKTIVIQPRWFNPKNQGINPNVKDRGAGRSLTASYSVR